MKKTITLLAFASILFCSSPKIYAWENKFTHPALTEKAVDISDLDDFVKGQLEFEGGVHAELVCMLENFHNFEKRMKAAGQDASRQRTILEWIKATGGLCEGGNIQ